MDQWWDRSPNACWTGRWVHRQLEVGWKLNVWMSVGPRDGRMLHGFGVNGLKDECWMNTGGEDPRKVGGWVVVVWTLKGWIGGDVNRRIVNGWEAEC